jgi:hypothetical protein
MSRFLWRSLSAAIAVLAVSFAAPTQAYILMNIKQPGSFHQVNPCNGENVYGTFTEHIVIKDATTSSGPPIGNDNFDVVDNVSGTGVGDQGNTYEFNGNFHSTINFHGSLQFIATNPFILRLTSKGSAPNFTLHILSHITFDANGDLTAFIDNYTAECH